MDKRLIKLFERFGQIDYKAVTDKKSQNYGHVLPASYVVGYLAHLNAVTDIFPSLNGIKAIKNELAQIKRMDNKRLLDLVSNYSRSAFEEFESYIFESEAKKLAKETKKKVGVAVNYVNNSVELLTNSSEILLTKLDGLNKASDKETVDNTLNDIKDFKEKVALTQKRMKNRLYEIKKTKTMAFNNMNILNTIAYGVAETAAATKSGRHLDEVRDSFMDVINSYNLGEDLRDGTFKSEKINIVARALERSDSMIKRFGPQKIKNEEIQK